MKRDLRRRSKFGPRSDKLQKWLAHVHLIRHFTAEITYHSWLITQLKKAIFMHIFTSLSAQRPSSGIFVLFYGFENSTSSHNIQLSTFICDVTYRSCSSSDTLSSWSCKVFIRFSKSLSPLAGNSIFRHSFSSARLSLPCCTCRYVSIKTMIRPTLYILYLLHLSYA